MYAQNIEKNDYLISICITSYNRIKELKRCLESIDAKESNTIEIVISEDNSPKKREIRSLVNNFACESEYEVVFNSNKENLGYDNNLGKLIELARGKYILFCSDDDYFSPGGIDLVISEIRNCMYAYAYTSFLCIETNELKREYNSLSIIPRGLLSIKKHHDDAILFSGLIFKRELIIKYDSRKFLNLNYFQVYLFLCVMYKYDGLYINVPLICCVGDGENAYGLSDSSEKNLDLIDRKSVFSNMEFNKGLIKVFKIFDEENGTNTLEYYAKEYSLKLYYPLSRARKISITCEKEYWKRFEELNLKIYFIAKVYYYLLIIFGAPVCDTVMYIPKKALIKKRSK